MQDESAPDLLLSAGSPAELPPPLGAGFWRTGRQARWIWVLVGFIALAALFAFLGRWQLERAIVPDDTTDTETAVALDSLVEPQRPASSDDDYWRKATVSLDVVPGDAMVLGGRTNTGEGVGYWVIVHTTTGAAANLAVAVGWTADESAAQAAADRLDAAGGTALRQVTGRYLPTESPQQGDFESGALTAMATAELVNRWTGLGDGGTYGGYLVLDDPAALLDGAAALGVEPIDSPPPIPPDKVNLLNLFYAIEWVVFAGAAVFLWWRLVRDAQLKALGIDPAQVRRRRRADRDS